ncbi:protein tyrosine phosphatase [Hymenobacter sp. HSC-4F20]|uniref:low molecular weight protein tyrosine phosphatase family protein n=1 Tax=Hymenobacter sp. HSC-4F20 TaxID=2864135 RepID=UPI001C73B0B6|nr:protein tyrosine phosphatase [Hymenobacter sp. HSC-4F20]MBX0289246.1 protein tyrosine phosphatase [Hymenobacter sp. HSC-4F20]
MAYSAPDTSPRKLLFICSQNRWRSLSAERLFDGHPHYEARSAGTEPGARVRVAAGHLGWADVVLVMERRHTEILQQKFREELAGKRIINLRIPDKFQFMDHILLDLLRERLREHLGPAVL